MSLCFKKETCILCRSYSYKSKFPVTELLLSDFKLLRTFSETNYEHDQTFKGNDGTSHLYLKKMKLIVDAIF